MRYIRGKPNYLPALLIILFVFTVIGQGFCAQIIGKVSGITGSGSDYENVEISFFGKKLSTGEHIAVIRKGKILTEGVIVLSGGARTTASFYKKGIIKVGDNIVRYSAMEIVYGSPYPVYKKPIFTYIDCHDSKYSSDRMPSILIVKSDVMNAYATYYQGKPVILVTDRMTKALFAYAYYLAIGEILDNSVSFQGIRFLALTEALRTNELPPCPRLPEGYTRAKISARAVELYHAMTYFVLAHEAGHISGGHVRSAFDKAGMSLNTDEYYDVIKASSLWLDREMEREADQTAVDLTLEKYGHTGEAAIKYLVLFMRFVEALKGNTPPEYLCTHPHWSTRYDYMCKMITTYWRN